MDEGAEISTKKQRFSLRKISFGRSRAYLAEYGLLLILILVLINVLGMMLQEIIGKKASFYTDPMITSYFPMFPGFFGDMTIGILAAFIVVFPAVIILIQRTASAEWVDSEIKKIGWRKGLLSIFIVISSLWAIISLVSVLIAGLNYLNLVGTSGNSFDWREASESGLRAVLFFLAVWAFAGDYRRSAGEKVATVMHIFRYGIVAVGIFGLVLFLLIPFKDNRGQALDTTIVNDLSMIQQKVNEFYSSNTSTYPGAFDQMNLPDDVMSRVQTNNYKYENVNNFHYKLCANFNTDNSVIYGKEYFVPDGVQTYVDFNNHKKGEQCFELSADYYALPAESGSDPVMYGTDLNMQKDLIDPYTDTSAGRDGVGLEAGEGI